MDHESGMKNKAGMSGGLDCLPSGGEMDQRCKRSWSLIAWCVQFLLFILAVVATGAFLRSLPDDRRGSGAGVLLLDDARHLFPEAAGLLPAGDNLFEVEGPVGSRIGFVIYGPVEGSSVAGHAGKVPFIIGIGGDGLVNGVRMLDSMESPAYADAVAANTCRTWNGLSPGMAVHKDVDSLTGATMTSMALINGVRETLGGYTTDAQFPRSVGGQFRWVIGSCLVAGYLCVACVAFFKPAAWAGRRRWFLVSTLLVCGVLANVSLSLSLFLSWLRGSYSLRGPGLQAVIFLITVVFALWRGRNFYCRFVCPFGAAQELAGGVIAGKSWQPGGFVSRLLPVARVMLVALAVLAALGVVGVDLVGLEPFAFFNLQRASVVLALSFVVLAFLTPRPWCRICPTGWVVSRFVRRAGRGL